MENHFSRHSRTSQTSLKTRRSGYEPSDNETDFLETPWHGHNRKISGGLESEVTKAAGLELARNISPFKHSRRHASRFEYDASSARNDAVVSPVRRRTSSKSPYKQRREDGTVCSPIAGVETRRNISPLSKAERRRGASPLKPEKEGHDVNDADQIVNSNRKQSQRRPGRDPQSRRSSTAPRVRARSEVEKKGNYSATPTKGERTPSPLSKALVLTTPTARERTPSPLSKAPVLTTPTARERTPSPISKGLIQQQRQHTKSPSVGEINEMIANAKLARTPLEANSPLAFGSSESFAPGDIFFSRECKILALPKTVNPTPKPKNALPKTVNPIPKPKNGSGFENRLISPNVKMVTPRGNGFDQNARGTPLSYNLSQTTTTTSSSALSRQSSKMSGTSGSTTASAKKFTANRKKSESHSLFACMRKGGSCRKTKSPEHSPVFNEASFIQKAFVDESLRQFWADNHRPASLNGFTCHMQEAQLLKDLVIDNKFPHILLSGPPGSGKKALTMAFLREIYGDASWEISHDLRCFQIQEQMSMQVMVPLTSSAHHIELNVRVEANARYALMGLVKEINSENDIAPEISTINLKGNHKVLVLYDVDRAAEHIQHLIKWIMDCYSEACKLILCCENDEDIVESVKNRCTVIKLDAPVTQEITEVLAQIARKENFDLPTNFANKIANKSKQNLRKAIMGLEATKAHNYPFVDNQPIPIGWEEVLVEVAAEILADPSPKRLFFIRGKFQKLLVGFVHPKLILMKLVEQFLKAMDGSSKRDLYYWHAYYEKRLPEGASALLKLEEFVAKFMSIYRKSANSRQYV
ncbi:uncharacterized protein LOC112187419 [Rosa chinensis]|uniref:uncharacterized protein LOC112187419 n=1 Tax=Rosa chinensis TaxID=74649 RepID=UPI000D0886B5|nr:uncharacterized protein LOC112187419 [Rosa chinensis]